MASDPPRGLEAFKNCELTRPFLDNLLQPAVTLIYALLTVAFSRVVVRPTVLGIEICDRSARVVCGEPACLNYRSAYAKVLQNISRLKIMTAYTYLHIDEPVVAAQVRRRSQLYTCSGIH